MDDWALLAVVLPVALSAERNWYVHVICVEALLAEEVRVAGGGKMSFVSKVRADKSMRTEV